jgi:hypothetical protein
MENEPKFLTVERLHFLHNSIDILGINSKENKIKFNDYITLIGKEDAIEESREIIRLIQGYNTIKKLLNLKLEEVSQKYLNKSFYNE